MGSGCFPDLSLFYGLNIKKEYNNERVFLILKEIYKTF